MTNRKRHVICKVLIFTEGATKLNSAEIRERLSKEFITVNDVAEILEISVNTVCRRILDGKIDAVNINPGSKATWRVRSISLKRLLGIEDNKQIPA